MLRRGFYLLIDTRIAEDTGPLETDIGSTEMLLDWVKVFYRPGSTESYTHCSWENETCSFSGTKKVRYGADGLVTSTRTRSPPASRAPTPPSAAIRPPTSRRAADTRIRPSRRRRKATLAAPGKTRPAPSAALRRCAMGPTAALRLQGRGLHQHRVHQHRLRRRSGPQRREELRIHGYDLRTADEKLHSLLLGKRDLLLQRHQEGALWGQRLVRLQGRDLHQHRVHQHRLRRRSGPQRREELRIHGYDLRAADGKLHSLLLGKRDLLLQRH